MKIEYENKSVAKFEKLGWGRVFKLGNDYYMKTDSIDGNGVQIGVNAVHLESGALAYFASDPEVEVVEAALTIKNKSAE